MTNTDTHPDELVCRNGSGGASAEPVQVVEPRDVPLGGLRAMPVRRTLPQRARSLIGAWCFCDHYGPRDLAAGGMDVAPHPHTGLQTVSWLFAGEIEHRDSIGSHAMVRPGELNLMTAGRGIAHTEVSQVPRAGDGAQRDVLHGVQLWVALPDAVRDGPAAFENVRPPSGVDGPLAATVFIGDWLGLRSPATVHSPLVGAELRIAPGKTVDLPVDPAFEYGVLVDAGEVAVDGTPVATAHLAYQAPGRRNLRLSVADGPTDARVVVLGGEPLGEQIVMWWNFVGRAHEEIVEYRRQWMAECGRPDVPATTDVPARFGAVAGYPGAPLPAPTLPHTRLKPRT